MAELMKQCRAADAVCEPLGMAESTFGFHFQTGVMKVEKEASKAAESAAFL